VTAKVAFKHSGNVTGNVGNARKQYQCDMRGFG
jgi:hypothetical protein